jgi:hypothetical protein
MGRVLYWVINKSNGNFISLHQLYILFQITLVRHLPTNNFPPILVS